MVVGNPPFLGGKLMRTVLGDDYVERLFAAYAGCVPAEADLVVYWFAKAWARMSPSLPPGAERVGVRWGFQGTGRTAHLTLPAPTLGAGPRPLPLEGGEGKFKRAGLVATNSIRGGANRRVLDAIVKDGKIFDAWDDEPWILEGAAVRVSLICFMPTTRSCRDSMENRLSASARTDRRRPQRSHHGAALDREKGVAFMGDTKGGAFDVPGDLARQWLQLPLNPNGRPNSDVLRPWMNGMDLTRRAAGKWIIDFG